GHILEGRMLANVSPRMVLAALVIEETGTGEKEEEKQGMGTGGGGGSPCATLRGPLRGPPGRPLFWIRCVGRMASSPGGPLTCSSTRGGDRKNETKFPLLVNHAGAAVAH
ncbi:unnamed protein product, partial [Prorocentrum cordatum]